MLQIEKAAVATGEAAKQSVANASGLMATLAENRKVVSTLVASVTEGLGETQARRRIAFGT